jgi:hypothetical protein
LLALAVSGCNFTETVACDFRGGSVGGCTVGHQGDGSAVNDWYYAPKTKDEARQECNREEGAFLEP